jgi:hypothetical protein
MQCRRADGEHPNVHLCIFRLMGTHMIGWTHTVATQVNPLLASLKPKGRKEFEEEFSDGKCWVICIFFKKHNINTGTHKMRTYTRTYEYTHACTPFWDWRSHHGRIAMDENVTC